MVFLVPTLIDCWHVRDLQRFRNVLKGIPTEKGSAGGGGGGANGNAGKDDGSNLLSSSLGKGGNSFGKSPGGGFSWGSAGNSLGGGPCPPSEVNRRDKFGRTALHLVSSSIEPVAIEYLNALLAHPAINVNLQDSESGWTALHRALYFGNLNLALTLLRRQDIDLRIKDFEGLTAFDLYNSTVSGTNPKYDPNVGGSDVFAWGANRNYSLGLGDGNDRALPDRIKLVRSEGGGSSTAPAGDFFDDETESRASSAAGTSGKVPGSRFDRIRVKDVGMSKMHTVLLTAERSKNIWVAGIGSNGRLGRAVGMQTKFEPLLDFHETAQSIAVAQDHTLILTTSGAVLSFGLNRFHQLGYAVEEGLGVVASSNASNKGGAAATATFGNAATQKGGNDAELDTQLSPRRIAGPLKKENVLGIAASKMHSAAFTSEGLYTWGTNAGQLGYDRNATPVQVVPRKVTTISQEIKQISATDYATACLFTNWDVLVLHNDAAHRVQFPMNRFRPEIFSNVFRPQQAHPKPIINKIAGSGTTFAVISDTDLFTFSLDHPSEYSKAGSGTSLKTITPKPQLVWSMRKNFTAVRDVAVSSDGCVILCTESGHVFVRTKRQTASSTNAGGILGASAQGKYVPPSTGKSSGKGGFKFQAVPYLQRVVRVAMNESGGFAAIRADDVCREIKIRGRPLEEALQSQLPHLRSYPPEENDEGVSIAADIFDVAAKAETQEDDGMSDADEDDIDSNARYVKMAQLIAEAARRWDQPEENGVPIYGPDNLRPTNGCDMFLIAGGKYIPCHRIVFAARIPLLAQALESPGKKVALPPGISVKQASPRITTLILPGCSFHAALFLLHYLYTDDLPPVWTASIGMQVEKTYSAVRINRTNVHNQLQSLATLLKIETLSPSLNSPVPRAPAPSLRKDLQAAYIKYVDVDLEAATIHDVQLQFKDRTVPAHSVLLRRSPFFKSLFHPAFSALRWDEGVIEVDMDHVEWKVAKVVLQHLYVDSGVDVFRGQDKGVTQEEFIDFVVDVLSASDHLLLEKLSLICSAVLRRRIYSRNIASILTEADFYHASALKEACMDLCTRSMETLLEGGMLNDLEYKAIKELSAYVRQRQDDRMHRSAAASALEALMIVNEDYIAGLDLPKPSLNLASQRTPRRAVKSPNVSPADGHSRRRSRPGESPAASPEVRAATSSLPTVPDSGLLFEMDDEDGVANGTPGTATPQRTQQQVQSSMAQMRISAEPTSKSATPWAVMSRSSASKGNGASSPQPSDLRSIMAAEQRRTPSGSAQASGSGTPIQGPQPAGSLVDIAPITIGAKLSQKDRKRFSVQQGSASNSSPSAAPWAQTPTKPAAWQTAQRAKPSPAASPWKLASNDTPISPSRVLDSTRSSSAEHSAQSPSRQVPSGTSAASPMAIGRTEATASGTISPMAASFTPNKSKVSAATWKPNSDTAGAAWATSSSPSSSMQGGFSPVASQSSPRAAGFPGLSTMHSTSPPPRQSFSGVSASFLEIQEQQKLEDNAVQEALARAAASRKSFAQIIEEEKAAEIQAEKERKEREEFEKWFEAESRKVQQQEKGRSKKGRKQSAAQSADASTADSSVDSDRREASGESTGQNTEREGATQRGRGRGRGGNGGSRAGRGRGGPTRGRDRDGHREKRQTSGNVDVS